MTPVGQAKYINGSSLLANSSKIPQVSQGENRGTPLLVLRFWTMRTTSGQEPEELSVQSGTGSVVSLRDTRPMNN